MSLSDFSQNERVLCYHGPLVYEAKILKTENWDEQRTTDGTIPGWHYFVHYKGWKQTWDEWVPSSRVLKLNETNIAVQRQLNAAAGAPSASAPGGISVKPHASASSKASTSRATSGRKDATRKRGRDDEDIGRKNVLKLHVPEALKTILLDDWQMVSKEHQLVPLSRSPTAAKILQEFQEYVIREKPATLREPELMVPTIVAGLLVYFDRSLGTNLLYRSELQQHADIRKKYITGRHVTPGSVVEMSSIYGAEHLLRMLVNLPQMIANLNMDSESVSFLRDYVNELMLYMLQERERMFLTAYETARTAPQNIANATRTWY